MNKDFKNKSVYIGDKVIITDWATIRVIPQDNLQEKIKANKDAEKEIEKQQKIVPATSNTIIAVR